MLRAYDKATGKEVGAVYMPAPQSGSPMTYMLNGRQYIVVAISGGRLLGRVDGVPAAAIVAQPEIYAGSAGGLVDFRHIKKPARRRRYKSRRSRDESQASHPDGVGRSERYRFAYSSLSVAGCIHARSHHPRARLAPAKER